MVKKIFKNIVLGFITFFFLLGITTLIISSLYKDKLIYYIEKQINKSIEAVIKVNTIKIELFRFFPNMGVTFNQVVIVDKKLFNDTLAHFNEISLKVNIYNILKNNYIINGINVSNGQLFLYTNTQGSNNYDIIKTDSVKNKELFWEINKVIIKNVQLVYRNQIKNQHFSTFISKLNASGSFTSKQLNINITVQMDYLKWDTLVIHDKFKLKSRLMYENNIFSCHHADLQVNGQRFNFDFYLNPQLWNVLLTGEKINFSKIFYINKYLVKNNLNNIITNVTLNIKKLANQYNPAVELQAEVLQGVYQFKNESIHIKNAAVQLKLKPTANKDFDLFIQHLTVQKNHSELTFDFNYNGLKHETILKGSGLVDLTDLKHFIHDRQPFQCKSGSVNFMIDAGSKKRLDSLFTSLNHWQFSVKTNIHSVNLIYQNKLQFDSINGTVHIQNDLIQWESIKFYYENGKFVSDGTLQNQFFSEYDPIRMVANIYANKININNVLKIFNSSDTLNKKEIYLKLKIKVKKGYYNSHLINDLSLNLYSYPDAFLIQQLRCKLWQGEIMFLDYQTQYLNNHQSYHYLNFKLNQIRIDSLFKSFNNFGQTNLTSTNFKGWLTTQGQITFYMANDKLITGILKGKLAITLTNAELIEYPMLKDLMKYINLQNPQWVKFSPISSEVVIGQNQISFSPLEIKSSAIDFTVSGNHSFDNTYAYRFKFYLSDILSRNKRVPEKPADLPIVEVEDSTNKSVVYVLVKGKGGNYKISYDTRESYRNFQNKLKTEAVTFKSILKEEFGLLKTDTSKIIKTEIKTKTPAIESEELVPIENQKPNPGKHEKSKSKPRIEWKDE